VTHLNRHVVCLYQVINSLSFPPLPGSSSRRISHLRTLLPCHFHLSIKIVQENDICYDDVMCSYTILGDNNHFYTFFKYNLIHLIRAHSLKAHHEVRVSEPTTKLGLILMVSFPPLQR
jgi:hypothetical protein